MIGCVVIPHFAVRVERREDPSLARYPLALADDRWRVYDVSPAAAEARVTVGMRIAEARARCSELAVRPASPALYRAAFETVLEGLRTFTHKVEPQGFTAYLDLGRLGVRDGQRLGREMVTLLRDQLDLSASVGLAPNRFSAGLVAHDMMAHATPTDQVRVLSPRTLPAFLDPLPVDRLPAHPDTLRRLHLLGIDTLHALADLPSGAVLAQFGAHGRWLQELARGHDPRPVLSTPPRRRLHHHHDFALYVEDRDIVANVLRDIGAMLADQLKRHDLTCGALTVRVRCADGVRLEASHCSRRSLSRAFEIATELVRLLDGLAIHNAVEAVAVDLDDLTAPVAVQLGLFDQLDAARTDQLRHALPRLIARHGAVFYRAELAAPDDPIPERRVRFSEMEAG